MKGQITPCLEPFATAAVKLMHFIWECLIALKIILIGDLSEEPE